MTDSEQNAGDDIRRENEQLKYKLGKQSAEVGELRKIVDEYIVKDAQVTAESFESDPVGAMEKMIEQKVQPLQQRVDARDAQSAEEKLREVHPDYESVVQDAGFQDWINGSRARRAAFETAVSGQLEVGIDLLSEYKESHATSPSNLNPALAAGRSGSSDMSTKNDVGALSRSEIMKRKAEDPEWYRTHADEILQAYAAGNIRP